MWDVPALDQDSAIHHGPRQIHMGSNISTLHVLCMGWTDLVHGSLAVHHHMYPALGTGYIPVWQGGFVLALSQYVPFLDHIYHLLACPLYLVLPSLYLLQRMTGSIRWAVP